VDRLSFIYLFFFALLFLFFYFITQKY